MNVITDGHINEPIPQEWEDLRRKVSRKAGRHAVIAGGAIRDHILGLTIKDIDIFILGMTVHAAKEIFNAEIIEYAGVEEAKHQYQTEDGLTVDLVFSQYNNVREVLEHFDLGICRAAWDGDYILTDHFLADLWDKKITTFFASPSGHRDRVLKRLEPIGFTLGEDVWFRKRVTQLRELANQQGYRLMHRRKDEYWLMGNKPMSLSEIEEKLLPPQW
jgi:hypothetical protein